MRVFLIASVLTVLISWPSRGQMNNLALVIGNGEYISATKLQNTTNDARDIAETLGLLGFEVMTLYNADYREMKKAIDEFGNRLKTADVGLFYYSGHGIQLNGYNYLIPVDAQLQSEQDAEYDCINAGRILSRMEGSGLKTSIIILDACRNNPFLRSWNRSLERNGLAYMEAPTGSLIAYSTAPGNTASDGIGRNGLYTKYLLKYMTNPELNVLQLFQEVRKNVREESNGKQIPWESTSLENDFYFNQSGTLMAEAQPGSGETVAWKRSDSRDLITEEIKSSQNYIWVESIGKELELADQEAKNELTARLMNHLAMRAGLDRLTPERNSGIGRIIGSLLLESQRKVDVKKKLVTVLRYLPLTDLENKLKAIENKAIEYAISGDKAIEENRVADALRNFYWANSLSSSYPGKIEFNAGTEKYNSMETYLEYKIPDIIQYIDVYVIDSSVFNSRVIYTLDFYYKKEKVGNINFIYWNGNSWSSKVCANNGSAIVSMYPAFRLKDLRLRPAFSDGAEAAFDPFLQHSIMEMEKQFVFNHDLYAKVKPGDYRKHHTISENNLALIESVLKKVKLQEDIFDEDLFTKEGYEVYRQLLLYGNASFLNTGNSYSSYEHNNNTFVRSVPFTFSFRNNSVSFSENLCFEINKEGLLSNITFALSNKAIEDIMKMERWPVESKLQIINFIENYKTAYALKQFDYIEKIFSDNALIIVGKKLEVLKKENSDRYYLTGNNYEFTQLTKEEYLYRLRRVFNRNEYINIQFEENVVKKRDNQSEVYGINIKQNYFSSSYADQGYLFLMVDMKDAVTPIIYVRSWQPEKFEDGHVINLSDFSY